MVCWRSGGVTSSFLNLSIRWTWVVRFTSRPTYPRGMRPRYALDRRIGGEDRISPHCPRRESCPDRPPRRLVTVLFTTASRTALGPTQPPIQWVPGAFPWGYSGRGVKLTTPSNAEVKEWVELYLHYLNTPSWRGAQLKHRDNFTFTFTDRAIK
jgi:hypothetical protein